MQIALKRGISVILIAALMLGAFAVIDTSVDVGDSAVYAAKTYKVKPKSKASRKYCNSKKYTKQTRIYFAIRERLEKLQKSGGGTLVFKKGTYVLTNALYVPSNVKIVFENGVVIKKGKKTGVKGWKASTSLFQLIKPSKSKKKNVYGKYNSSSNVTFEGIGNVVIDLRYYKKNHGIMAAHNNHLTIRNITFKNSNAGHFIELNSNANTLIENCKFIGSKGDVIKEAINLDTPDKSTGGWSQKWSKFDKTPCTNVRINACYFANMGHAIGTHKYSYGYPHTNIQITNCTIVGTRGEEGIRMQNWVNPVIANNTISGNNSSGNLQGIIGRGVSYPTITNNRISGFRKYAIFLRDGWNNGKGNKYPHIYTYVSDANRDSFSTNVVTSGPREIYMYIGKGMTRTSMMLN